MARPQGFPTFDDTKKRRLDRLRLRLRLFAYLEDELELDLMGRCAVMGQNPNFTWLVTWKNHDFYIKKIHAFLPMFVYMIIPVEKSGFNPIHLSFIELWIGCNTVVAMFIDQGWHADHICGTHQQVLWIKTQPSVLLWFSPVTSQAPDQTSPSEIPRKWEPKIKRCT